MKIMDMLSQYKIIELVSVIVSVCALAVSISALSYSRSAYRMSSVDYSPSINIKTSKETVKIINEDDDLFYIDSIKIIGEHFYEAMVNQTSNVKEYVPFVIRDYYYDSPVNGVNLDNITISLLKRYQNGTVKYNDKTVIPNYNHVIDTGLKKLNAQSDGMALKFVIQYTNKRNHRSNHLYLSCDTDEKSRIYEFSEDELYSEGENEFTLTDGVHRIEEKWKEVETYVEQEINNGRLMKAYTNIDQAQ